MSHKLVDAGVGYDFGVAHGKHEGGDGDDGDDGDGAFDVRRIMGMILTKVMAVPAWLCFMNKRLASCSI